MQYEERKLALSFIVTILKITTIHNSAHFPSFKTVPQLPIPHFSLVSWKIHLCKYSVCWLSVIVSGPICLLQLHYLCTMSKSSPFLPRGSNLFSVVFSTMNRGRKLRCLREKPVELNIYLFCPLSSPLVRGHVTQTWLQHMLFVQLKWQGTQEEGEGIIQGVIRDIEWSWGLCEGP